MFLPAELRKQREPVTIASILLSQDGLGEVNQDYGRGVGDQLLAQMSSFLKTLVGADERLYHPDGANFAIKIPDASEGRARRKATELRTDFREAVFTVGNREFKGMTCSAGVGTLDAPIPEPQISESVEALYRQLADRLYKAKQRGGNTIVGSARKDL